MPVIRIAHLPQHGAASNTAAPLFSTWRESRCATKPHCPGTPQAWAHHSTGSPGSTFSGPQASTDSADVGVWEASGVESDDDTSSCEDAALATYVQSRRSQAPAARQLERLAATCRGTQGSLLATVGGVAMLAGAACDDRLDATTRSQLRQEDDVRSRGCGLRVLPLQTCRTFSPQVGVRTLLDSNPHRALPTWSCPGIDDRISARKGGHSR